MSNPLGISVGTFSKTIWAGRLSKDRSRFLEGKQDVTDLALRAVGQYAKAHFDGAVRAEYSDFDVEIRVIPKGGSTHE